MSTNISCPECNHSFKVEEALALQYKQDLKKEFELNYLKAQDELTAKYEALELREQKFKASEMNRNSEIQKLAKELAEKDKKAFAEVLTAEKEQYSTLLESQKAELLEARKKAIENGREIQELRDKEEQMELIIQERILAERSKIKSQAIEEEQNRNRLIMAEQNELIKSLTSEIDNMKRKVAQGSMQRQGEALETQVELLLQQLHPQDEIIEIKKGVSGSDCLHNIMDGNRNVLGVISVESKNTKRFSYDWITKLKSDMRQQKATEGIIVTEALPKEIDNFGLIDGIWICRFSDLEILSRTLRHAIIGVHNQALVNTGKQDKMSLLYEYMTGSEFKQQLEAIVKGYTSMKEQIVQEQRAMKKQWKSREKQLDIIIDGATGMYGTISGIAGSSIESIQNLELDV